MSMKKLEVIVLIVLLLIPFANSLGEKIQGTIRVGETGETITEQQRTLSQQLETQIKSSISTGTTVNLNAPEYRDNPEVVKRVLKEKYNLDIDSFTGAKIEGGVLQLAGGTEISLTTGKNIHLEIQGGTVKRYQDADTTILNAEGVKIDSSTKEVKKAEAVKDGETDIQFLQTYKDDGQTTTIAQATLISSDNSIINNAKSITLKRSNNKVNAEITLSTVDLTLDKGTTFQYQNIQGTADENGATVKITKLAKETRVETKFTTTKFENDQFQETLIAKTASVAHIDNTEGFYELELGPISRFSSRNKRDETKSFFYLNTGDETNKIFITKPTHRLIPELISNYQFFARQDEFTMHGKGDWGVYKDAVPFVMVESMQEKNSIKIQDDRVSISYDCTEETRLAALHTGEFLVVDVCEDRQAHRFADFEELGTPERFKKITTNNLPEIDIRNGILYQYGNNMVKMYSGSQQHQFIRNLKEYAEVFGVCAGWEQQLDNNTTLLGWLRT